jgi:hypothetical protein
MTLSMHSQYFSMEVYTTRGSLVRVQLSDEEDEGDW